MEFITKSYDTDETLLLSLTLFDLQKICQTSKNLNRFCQNNQMLQYKLNQTKIKVNHFMTLLHKRRLVLLQPTTEHDLFTPFNDILSRFDILPDVEEDELKEIINAFEQLYIYSITIEHIHNTYNMLISFHNINDNENNYMDIYYIYNSVDPIIPETLYYVDISINNIQKFLLHLFYNNMVLSF